MNKLTVPGTLDSLDQIAQYVMQCAAEAGLDHKKTYKLRLAVDEIATNIILHGYEANDYEGTLELKVEQSPEFLKIVIEDTGPMFDPRSILSSEEATLKQPLEERPIGQLGIYLTIEAVDDFHYERVSERNCNTFIVKR